MARQISTEQLKAIQALFPGDTIQVIRFVETGTGHVTATVNVRGDGEHEVHLILAPIPGFKGLIGWKATH